MPDWGWVHRELRRPDVTLALLWEEYRAGAADGFGPQSSRQSLGRHLVPFRL
jgi:transposase